MEKHSYLGDGDSRNWNWDERVDLLVCEGSMCVSVCERESIRENEATSLGRQHETKVVR